jgi:hypothetical protein
VVFALVLDSRKDQPVGSAVKLVPVDGSPSKFCEYEFVVSEACANVMTGVSVRAAAAVRICFEKRRIKLGRGI